MLPEINATVAVSIRGLTFACRPIPHDGMGYLFDSSTKRLLMPRGIGDIWIADFEIIHVVVAAKLRRRADRDIQFLRCPLATMEGFDEAFFRNVTAIVAFVPIAVRETGMT